MKHLSFFTALIISYCGFSQVGIGTSTPQATLDIRARDVTGTSNEVDGILIPRVDRQRAQSMTGMVTSTIIYVFDISTGTSTGIAQNINTVGYYYFDGSNWARLTTQVDTGDIKTSFRINDHNGWVRLDGRATATLTPTQQVQATALGIGANLPNATNRVLMQNTLLTTGGSNSVTLTQANLPNVNFTGSTSSVTAGTPSGTINSVTAGTPTGTIGNNGSHTHGHNAPGGNGGPGLQQQTGVNTPTAIDNGIGAGEDDVISTLALEIDDAGSHTHPFTGNALANHNHTFTGNALANHNHTVTVSSGGSATAVNTTPAYIGVNMFIYLGN